MNLQDLFSSILWTLAMPPKAAVTNDTAFVSEILDMQGAEEGLFLGLHGTNADADAAYTVLVEDGDDAALSDNAAVANEYLRGVEAMGLDFADDNKAFKISYRGPKRYVRVTITPANNTGNAFIAGGWIRWGLRVQPQTAQVN